MLRQLWMSGILAAFLVFGVKIGAGLGSQLNHPGLTRLAKWIFISGCLGIYLLLFWGMYFLVTGLNLLAYIDRFANVLKYGMVAHVALASGLLAWGTKLVLPPGENKDHSPLKAGLLLVLPCPVCAAVILLNLTLAFSLFPMTPAVSTALLFACFLGFIMITVGVITLFRSRIRSMDAFLGFSMILVSLYFVLTILIAPVYPEIKAAFAMAVSNNPACGVEMDSFMILAVTILVVAGTGFYRSYFRKTD